MSPSPSLPPEKETILRAAEQPPRRHATKVLKGLCHPPPPRRFESQPPPNLLSSHSFIMDQPSRLYTFELISKKFTTIAGRMQRSRGEDGSKGAVDDIIRVKDRCIYALERRLPRLHDKLAVGAFKADVGDMSV